MKGATQTARDLGSAAVWLVGLMAFVVLATVIGVVVGAAARASATAATAADLAALAGADVLVRQAGDPCARAAGVARANHVDLTRCEVDGTDLRVWTEVRVPVVAALGSGRARARAGPAERLFG